MDTDKNFWHLLDPNFDKIAELPSAASHFKFILNEPGSGSLSIPMTSNAASLVSSGMFARSSYRGAVRGGFSIDNIKQDFAIEGNADGGLWMNLSGSGELILLEDGIVYSGGDGTVSTRTFTGTKAAAFITLFDEAKARTGCLTDVTYDFTASVDSDGVGWTDTDPFTVTVGVTLLEVLRQIVKFGIDFKMSLVGGGFVLSAYKNGIGDDVSSTVFFRVGHNCTMVSSDERGGGLKNALLLAFRDGSVSIKDDTSIAAYRRREKFINAENAQNTAAVITYGSALLEGLKAPKRAIAVKVYDGVAPNLFLDYGMGDTVSLDIEGAIETHRVLGIQCDWDGTNYSNITLELNALLYEHELKMAQDIEWLLGQWNTARDSDLLAVSYWAAIGDASISYNASDFVIIGDYLYLINGSTTILKYGLKDGIWYPIVLTALPRCMAAVGTDLYVGGTLQVIKYDTLTDTQTYVTVGGGLGAGVNSMAVNGTTLYAAGEFTSINSVAATNIAKLNTLTSTWSSMADEASFLMTVPALSVMLYSNGLLYSAAGTQVQAWNGTVWANVGSSFGGNVLTFAEYGTSLLVGGQMTSGIHIWDGVSWSVFGGGVNGAVRAIGVYLTDVYIGGSFTDAGSYVARYSGGVWGQLDSGVNALVDGLILNGQDLYVAGDFTEVGSTAKPAQGIAAFFNTFESLVDYLENSSSSFNMGAAIHAAPASVITDTDEVPFWEATANALRKITWANIKATLKTYFDTLYVAWTVLTDSKDPTGWVDPSAITATYDSTARTITLTGTLQYYWRGVKTTLTSPWTSSAHTATNGGWFLSSTDGTNFTWSTTVWTFDVLMVAFVNYGATYKFALRETHGLMQWQTHEELHTTIGTYKESGGTLSGYTLASTTAANRRPDVAATHLHDEDNETTNAALTSKLYNKLYLTGAGATITYTGETADIVPLLANNPYYNRWDGAAWIQTLMANNSYMCVWLVAIPTTADTTSQTYRYTWVQGQGNGNLASQTALTPSDLNLAAFTTEATEFVFLAKIIIRYTGGNWDLNSVTILTGNRMIQVGSPAGAYLSSVATDATLTGDGSLASPLSVVGGGGGTPGGSDTHVQYNNGGVFGGESDFAWDDVTKTFLVGGSNWYSALSALTGGIHVSKDAGGTFTNIIMGHSWADGVDEFTGVPALGADRAGGIRATPTAVLDNMGLARFIGAGYDGTTMSGTQAQVLLRAAGNWSGTSHPTKIEFWTTPVSSVTRRKVLTVGQDGNVDILAGKTYNVDGSPHTHTAAEIAAVPHDGWVSDARTWTYYNRTQAFTNDPAAGVNIVLNMTDTTGFVVGDLVTVSSSAGSENAMITTVVTNTSITVNILALNHTTTSRLVTSLGKFKVSGDYTAVYKKRLRLRWTQTSVKYGVVQRDSTYDGADTLVSVIVNSDYTVANAAISSTSYSYMQSPMDFPDWFSYAPGMFGFSANPTTTVSRFMTIGRNIRMVIRQTPEGTSNSVSLTLCAPVLAVTVSNMFWLGWANVVDNSVAQANPGVMYVGSAGTVVNVAKDSTLTGFTASGLKRCAIGNIEYEW